MSESDLRALGQQLAVPARHPGPTTEQVLGTSSQTDLAAMLITAQNTPFSSVVVYPIHGDY